MAKILLALLCFTAAVFAQDKNTGKGDKWEAFRYFIGKWEGTGTGTPGSSAVEREYSFRFPDKFIEVKSRSVYAPQEKNPNGETHEDFGLVSYDNTRKTFVLRQFHIEGFVNQYTIENISADGKVIAFITEAIENIPGGWRARETYRITNENEFTEVFELAPPGKDFEVYSTNTLKRK